MSPLPVEPDLQSVERALRSVSQVTPVDRDPAAALPVELRDHLFDLFPHIGSDVIGKR